MESSRVREGRRLKESYRSLDLERSVASELWTLFADRGYRLKMDVATHCVYDGLERAGLRLSRYGDSFIVRKANVVFPLGKLSSHQGPQQGSEAHVFGFLQSVPALLRGYERRRAARLAPQLMKPSYLRAGFHESVQDYLLALHEEAFFVPGWTGRSVRGGPLLLDEVREDSLFDEYLRAGDDDAPYLQRELVCDYLVRLGGVMGLDVGRDPGLFLSGASSFPEMGSLYWSRHSP